MKTIRIDDDVYRYLQSRAIPYEESSPNETMRRLFGLELRQIDLFAMQMDEDRGANENDLSHPRFQGRRPVGQDTSQIARARHPRKRKTNLRILVMENILKDGQTLYLHDYSGQRIPGRDFEAMVSGDRLIWKGNGQSYSLSSLAIELLRKRGHRGESVRGPARWFTEDDVSVQTLWDRYLRK